MSAPLKIGVDIDGTIYPWTFAANEALMERYGIPDPGEHVTWSYLKEQITPEQWNWIWSSDGAEPVFGRLDMIFGAAAEVINALARDHHVHFVTHRNPYRLTEITGRWLKHHFRNYRGVHTVDNSVQKHTLGKWDVFIDDKMETIDEFLFHAPKCLTMMPCRPWNDEFRAPLFAPNFEAFRDWREVGGLIDDFAGVRETQEASEGKNVIVRETQGWASDAG